MAKERLEKRYRVNPNMFAPMYHDLFKCHVLQGEDYNMDCAYPDGRKWKYPDDIQFYLDNHWLEIYFVPVGTPHVVHLLGEREHVDPETGAHSRVKEYTTAANQWAGETVFIEQYVETKTAEVPQVKE
jgi:hypothetical protein